MFYYLLKRLLYAIPIIIGVNVLTFSLFFMVNTPDDMARLRLGDKYVTPEAVARWKHSQGLDKPLFFNASTQGLHTLTDTLFFTKTLALFRFKFGLSQEGRAIQHDIYTRVWPSLALAVPTLIIGLLVNITLAILMVFFRRTYIETSGVLLCLGMMSISTLFYIIVGQFLLAKTLRLLPISGYLGGFESVRFLILPIIISVISAIGANTRWYRTLLLEELEKNYVRTARAKGLNELQILYRHILKNAMIPIVTSVVALIPLLFMGSLLMESFFGIPGLGSYTIDAIQQQDFEIVRVMVFLGTLFYIVGLILTDIVYTWIDPRISFSKARHALPSRSNTS